MSPNRAHPPGRGISPAFHAGLAAVGAAGIVTDPHGSVIQANQAALTLFGLSAELAESRRLSEILPATPESIRNISGCLGRHKVATCQFDLHGEGRDVQHLGINCLLANDGSTNVLLFLIHPNKASTGVTGPFWQRLAAFDLSDSEMRVLVLMAEGLINKEVAALLHLKVWTVDKHVSTIIRKMQVASRTEACVRAIRDGLIW
jgi:PAS domain S-box-containing protein